MHMHCRLDHARPGLSVFVMRLLRTVAEKVVNEMRREREIRRGDNINVVETM